MIDVHGNKPESMSNAEYSALEQQRAAWMDYMIMSARTISTASPLNIEKVVHSIQKP